MKVAIFLALFVFSFGVLKCEHSLEEQNTESRNILVILTFGTASHVIVFTPLLQALSRNGHRITFVTMLNLTESVPGTEQIYLDDLNRAYEKWRPNTFKSSIISDGVARKATELLEQTCHVMYQDERILSLLERKFDLVIVNSVMGECALPLIEKLQVPYISLCTTTLYAWTAWNMNVPTPFSNVPHQMTSYSNVMDFKERVLNSLMYIAYLRIRDFLFIPTAQVHARKYFPNMSPIEEIDRNASLILVNSHPSLDIVRPTMPFIIEVGGMHCRPGKTLPKDLEEFLEGSGENGFIFFSLGTNIKGTDMPESMIRMFIEAFSQLEQRIIWKFEANLTDLPRNILVTRWAPQQDLLAHPSARLFLTHAGQLSTQEAVYHAVPMIGMPLYADQFGNVANVVRKGLGEALYHQSLTADVVLHTIREVLSDKRYKENMLKYSRLFKDRPEKSVDTALYWVEYVMRHGGAHHLKSPVQHLNLLQYFLIDVIAFGVFVMVTVIVTVIYIVRFIARRVFVKGYKNKMH